MPLQLQASRRGLHLTDEVGRSSSTAVRAARTLCSICRSNWIALRSRLSASDHSFPQNPRLVASTVRRRIPMAVPQSRLGFACGEVTAFYPSLHPCAGNTGALSAELPGGRQGGRGLLPYHQRSPATRRSYWNRQRV